jgi:exodeoxyribonuclease VII small subunit
VKKSSPEIELKALLKLTPADIEAMPYETALEALETVVTALEAESASLEMGLKLYEIGSALGKKCGHLLDQTEARMVQLVGTEAKPAEEPFDPEKDGR